MLGWVTPGEIKVSIVEGLEQETPIWKDWGEALGLGERWD